MGFFSQAIPIIELTEQCVDIDGPIEFRFSISICLIQTLVDKASGYTRVMFHRNTHVGEPVQFCFAILVKISVNNYKC